MRSPAPSTGRLVAGALLVLPFASAPASGDLELPAPRVLSRPTSSFDPARDAFAFANGLRWEYETGATREPSEIRESQKAYSQRCSQMARAARQFLRSARFAPELDRVPEAEYRELAREVMDSGRRATQRSPSPIVIPGYANLREFSREHGELLKELLGGRWRAYFQRGNWRMIFAYSPAQQRRTAATLRTDLENDHPPIVHLIRFPKVSINHTMLIYRAVETSVSIDFIAYDPNHPDRDVVLHYDRARQEFSLEPTFYWAGGRVITYPIFRGWLY